MYLVPALAEYSSEFTKLTTFLHFAKQGRYNLYGKRDWFFVKSVVYAQHFYYLYSL